MRTPVLSKQQQRESLSGKKTPSKTIRNVLSQPQDNFWPVVPEDKCALLEKLLNELMPAIKRPSKTIPWSKLRHMKKEERMEAKQEALSKEPFIRNANIGNSVILGINAITRSLEKDNACSILMDANIDPQLLVKHIVHMAQNKKVPILLLPKLKIITLNTIGFASAACALKDTVVNTPDHHFHPLYLTIHDIFKDIPQSDNRLQLFKDIEAPEETMICDEHIMLENDYEIKHSEPDKFTISEDVYLYRSSRTERVFVPPNSTASSDAKQDTQSMEEDGFISLAKYDSDDSDGEIKKRRRYVDTQKTPQWKNHRNDTKANKSFANVKYLPLKVKRVQGNANRVKATKAPKQKKKC